VTDHRWLSLAKRISEWPKSEGGYVVTRADKLIIGTGVQSEAAQHWEDSSLYYVPSQGSVLWADDLAGPPARLIVPCGFEIYGVDLSVEIEEIEL